MKHARLFSIIVLGSAGFYGAIGLYFLPMATFQSELTRMAMLPESMFGWTKPQPAIDPELMHQSSWQQADVLVIGDSFSDGRVWQTILTKSGLRVRTERWDGVRGICEDFKSWLTEKGFKGQYIVFEAIERNVADGAREWGACQHMQYHSSVYTDTLRAPPSVSYDPQHRDYSGRFSIGIQTWINALKYDRDSRLPNFTGVDMHNGVRLARINNGCNKFSHARCDDSLFLSVDRPEDLSVGILDSIEKLNARMPEITPIWVFVPNKSTAYLYPGKQFWNKAEQRINAPNVLNAFRNAIDTGEVDLYPANNTHISTAGYLLLGNTIFQNMQSAAKNK